MARSASSSDVDDQDGDLLCRKGRAAATRSRSYDHKDAFEPAQGAVAPPSDADELGSWLKYEGAVVTSEDRAAAVLDEERPTSWFKYEAKPMASLLDSGETLRRKAAIRLAEADRSAPAARTEPATTALSDHEPKIAETGPAHVTIPEAPSALAETTPVAGASQVDAQPETEIAAAMVEDGAADAPEAVPLPPIRPTAKIPESEIATGAPASIENRPDTPLHAAQEATAEPIAPSWIQDPSVGIAQASTPLPSIQECANGERDVDTPIETAPASFDDTVSMPVGAPEEEQLFTADAAPLAEPPTTDAPDFSEAEVPAPASELCLGQSGSIPALEAPVEALTPISGTATPTDSATPMVREDETAPAAVPEVTVRNPAKKAILARLAAMLEQALATKPIADRPESSQSAPALDPSDAPSSAVEEPPMMKANGAADAELPSTQLPDITAEHPEPPELAEAPWSALPDPRVSAEGLEARALEPTGMPAEESAPEIASPIEPDTLELLQSNDEGPPATAGVAAVEIDSALAETPVKPEELEPVLGPIGDEPAAEPPSGQMDETVTAALASTDDPELAADAPGIPPTSKRAALARLFGMLEQALSRKTSRQVTREPLPSAEPHEPAQAQASTEMAPAADESRVSISAALEPEPTEADKSPVIAEAVEPAAPVASASALVEIEVPEASAETEPSVHLPIPSGAGSSVDAEAINVIGAQPQSETETSAGEQEAAVLTNTSPDVSAPAQVTPNFTEASVELEPSVSASVPSETGSLMATEPVEADAAQQPPDDEARSSEQTPVMMSASPDVSAPEQVTTELAGTTLESEPRATAPVSDETGSSMVTEPVEADAAQRSPDDETLADAQAPVPTGAPPDLSAAEPVTAELAETNPESEWTVGAPASPEIEPSMAARAEAAQPPSDDETGADGQPIHSGRLPVVEIKSVSAADIEAPSETSVAALESSDAARSDESEAPAIALSIDDALADDAAMPMELAGPSLSEPAIPADAATEVAKCNDEPSAAEQGERAHRVSAEDEADVPLPPEVGPEPEPQIPTASTAPLEPTPADTGALVAEAAAVVLASDCPAPVVDPPAEEPPPAAVSRVDQDKTARQALTNDLADIIQDVLSTTQFASKAMKPGRYTHAQMLLETEAMDLEGELAVDALPHPVAIRSRLGPMERLLAFASVGMMIAGGYFAFSMWSGGNTVAAPAAVVAAPAATPDPWGERTRDMARELGSTAVVTDMSAGPGMARQGGADSAGPQPRTK